MVAEAQPLREVAPLGRLLDINDVAEILGVNVRHVRRLVFENRIPYLKWGRLLRFDPKEIERWLRGLSRREAGA